MEKLKIGIVEDEVIIADHLAVILLKLGYNVVEPAASYTEAIVMIEKEMPDLLLLDIQLKGKRDGIDLALKVKENYNIPVIFLTANADSVTVERAKKANPSAYLIKPFTKDDLYTAIEICIFNSSGLRSVKSTVTANNLTPDSAIYIKEGLHFVKVKFSDILYLECEHVYVKVHTLKQTFLVRTSLQEYLEYFNDTYFFRIHRCYAINLEHIQRVNGESVILNGLTLPVGKSYREQLLHKLKLI